MLVGGSELPNSYSFLNEKYKNKIVKLVKSVYRKIQKGNGAARVKK